MVYVDKEIKPDIDLVNCKLAPDFEPAQAQTRLEALMGRGTRCVSLGMCPPASPLICRCFRCWLGGVSIWGRAQRLMMPVDGQMVWSFMTEVTH